MEYEFTSESVSIGHPDKVADLISDAVATFLLSKNISHRAAIETLVTTNMVTIAGEYKSNNFDKDEIEKIIRDVVAKIGYEQEGFHHEHLNIYNELHGQSPDIALGTDNFGAGDQGLMFGYACLETDNYMPMAIYLCHKILKRVQNERENHAWILPDNKSQVTLTYSDINKPENIEKIVCSTQHSDDVDIEHVRKKIEEIIRDEIIEDLSSTEFLINPTGRFVVGGPDGDTGLTGRKIIVDTYGGYAPHGGGAFSGKDCTKVDRSGAYMARYLAKNIVSSGRASNATVQLSYAIGVVEPTSVYVYADGKVRPDLANWIKENVDLSPKGIIDKFRLFELDLTETTLYGHFGRDNLPYERLDLF
ncbi:MAG: methionine adenosyltransferase [Gammaproteobacteria bacterium]|tara:strand:+ start:494 stop:1579 length:1086 start_codon:yes stop_codon:yes gene_type:complete